MKFSIKDPVSGYSHLIGALIFFAGTVLLVKKAENAREVVSFLIFGASTVLLYLASSLYHLFGAPAEKISYTRKMDHALIYLLIAGTFTPFCLVLVRGIFGWTIFASVWAIAIAGTTAIFFDSFWKKFPRWASTGLYLLMGWIGAALIYPLRGNPTVLAFIAAGGILYTVGAVIYIFKKPNLNKYVGFHELFHFFTLAGTFAHFWCIYYYVA